MTGTELAKRSAGASIAADPDSAVRLRIQPWMMHIEEHPSWDVLSQLRVSLQAGIPLNGFKVRNLLALQEDQVFESMSPHTEDVSLRVGKVQLGWSEFEVIEQRMAVRLTRLG